MPFTLHSLITFCMATMITSELLDGGLAKVLVDCAGASMLAADGRVDEAVLT